MRVLHHTTPQNNTILLYNVYLSIIPNKYSIDTPCVKFEIISKLHSLDGRDIYIRSSFSYIDELLNYFIITSSIS